MTPQTLGPISAGVGIALGTAVGGCSSANHLRGPRRALPRICHSAWRPCKFLRIARGDIARAIEAYASLLQVHPDHRNAASMIAQLRKKREKLQLLSLTMHGGES
jgi:hypothetical protein